MTTAASPTPGRGFVFAPFRLDLVSQQLWRDQSVIRLRPKSWDLLRYLVERPGHLVTKAAVHRELWRDTVVSDDTLTQLIKELRRALDDDARTPRFIETVHGRGFRFLAEVRPLDEQAWSPAAVSTGSEPALPFVG